MFIIEKSEVVIGVPGMWENRTELIQAIASKSDGYLMAGQIIYSSEKDKGYHIEVYEHDPELKEAFFYASRQTFDEDILADLEKHNLIVYVVVEVNGFNELKEVVEIGSAILKAGGIAINLESSGIAHSKEQWSQLENNMDYFPMYSHFITLIGNEDDYFSCGMKAFGLPDAVLPSTISIDEAADLLNNFNLYHIIENPKFNNGETFSMDPNSPYFRIQTSNDNRYDVEDILYNPFGLLKLTPL